MSQKIIRRTFQKIDVEARAEEGRGTPRYIVRGYAALYGRPSRAGGWFEEVIEKGAFSGVVERSDIRALLNHDPNHILARFQSGREENTLTVRDDDNGLFFEFEMPSNRSDLIEAMERGDINQNSFAFTLAPDGDEWEESKGDDEIPLRRTKKVDRLYDVSVVTYPFYEDSKFEIEKNSYDLFKKMIEEDELKEEKSKEEDLKRIQEVSNAYNEWRYSLYNF